MDRCFRKQARKGVTVIAHSEPNGSCHLFGMPLVRFREADVRQQPVATGITNAANLLYRVQGDDGRIA